MLYEELSSGRPVLYSGSKNMSGHEFVCDGYDGNGMFHINWGWNGLSNGYFLLNVLDPDTGHRQCDRLLWLHREPRHGHRYRARYRDGRRLGGDDR